MNKYFIYKYLQKTGVVCIRAEHCEDRKDTPNECNLYGLTILRDDDMFQTRKDKKILICQKKNVYEFETDEEALLFSECME